MYSTNEGTLRYLTDVSVDSIITKGTEVFMIDDIVYIAQADMVVIEIYFDDGEFVSTEELIFETEE